MAAPKNHGKAWTEEDVQKLIYHFNNRSSLESMARSLDRTANGVMGKLQAFGLVITWGKGYRRVEADQWISFDQISAIEDDIRNG